MRNTISTIAVLICIGTGVSAQETYGEIYEKGAMDLNSMEEHLAQLLRAHNVPESCLAQLNVTDASRINSIINSDVSQGNKQNQVKGLLTEKCSS